MMHNDLFLRAARRERTERPPIWLMRQAGRFDPNYRALRDHSNLSLEDTFENPELAAEISLLPGRFGVDVIIFFQDILTPLSPMGARFTYRPAPFLQTPIRTQADVDKLRCFDAPQELQHVTKIINLVSTQLAGSLPLLGFAGAPLTLAFFLIEGRSPGRDPVSALAFLRSNAALCHRLLDQLTDMTIDYLNLQIDAGANAIQLFESIADLITPEQYRTFAHPYHVKIFNALQRRVPTILFVKEQPFVDLMATSGADVLSVGSCVDLKEATRRYGHRVAFQGNVNNHLLAKGPTCDIVQAVKSCIRAGGGTGHILNLNHGLLKNTPVDHVRCMIDTARQSVTDDQPVNAKNIATVDQHAAAGAR